MKAASFFSGIGGLDLGLKRAGIEITSMCEQDEYRREVLLNHFSGIKIYKDISEVYYGEPKSRSSASRLFSATQNGRKTRAGLPGSIDTVPVAHWIGRRILKYG